MFTFANDSVSRLISSTADFSTSCQARTTFPSRAQMEFMMTPIFKSLKQSPQAEARFMKTHHNLVQFRSKKSVRVQEKRAPVLKSKVLLSFGFFVSYSLNGSIPVKFLYIL